ncbi:MAG: hypothetical protein K2N87_01125 [Eubacterium sp.]|nr:hypothetical protein [Eubacterium sp.]
MKVLLITAAGMSERFRASLGHECLKCIYYKDSIEESLLYRMLHQNVEFDRYIIVGGFRWEELKETVYTHFSRILPKLVLVENERYCEYGSGYSLYLGLKEAAEAGYDELVFAEGDLYVDSESFQEIFWVDKDVVTCTRERIQADSSVAFYYDKKRCIHYLYDTGHQAFMIKEPFVGIFNSGQVWKFKDQEKMDAIISSMPEEELQGTNLAIIQKYFSGMSEGQYKIIEFNKWVNCNTIYDFYKIK